MTNKLTKLVNDARAAGYTIRHYTETRTTEIKRQVREDVTVGLVVYENSTAYRLHERADLTPPITDVAEMRRVLELD